MGHLRVAVTIVIVLVWGLFVPVAMAVDHCAAMGAMCEGPCGASSTVATVTVPADTDLVTRAPSVVAPTVPQFERAVLELPPKSLAPSA